MTDALLFMVTVNNYDDDNANKAATQLRNVMMMMQTKQQHG
jgi:hypothetical protein